MVVRLKLGYLLTFRVLEWLQASWLWRGGRAPSDTTSSLLWKPAWNHSSTPSTSYPAIRSLPATTPGWGRAKFGQWWFRLILKPRSSVSTDSSSVSGRGERGGSVDGGWGGWRACDSAPTCDWWLRDWSMRLPARCRWRLRAWGRKRGRAPDVQGCRWGLLLRAPASGLPTEGAHLGAAQPNHQHQHWRPHGVILNVPANQFNALLHTGWYTR